MKTWMVRVWYNAYDDEEFIDEMPNHDFIFSTEAEALEFKKAFNEKFWNHGGWEPYFSVRPTGEGGGVIVGRQYVAGSPAEGPYERVVETEGSVEEALALACNEAHSWGMEEEEE
ncbi:MAG: hypothetical protein L7U25_06690 [Candidatus Poseidonia sp.]|nr:hypothetical protein [Poseidonia sp.]